MFASKIFKDHQPTLMTGMKMWTSWLTNKYKLSQLLAPTFQLKQRRRNAEDRELEIRPLSNKVPSLLTPPSKTQKNKEAHRDLAELLW